MSLFVGDRLGPYEILAPIGSGGMGEVYKARDTRLDRIVAIKASKTEFSERFEREARAVGALNHPHICQLYDVGPNYLVMEHIEGTPLKGPLPLGQALKYAAQICDALDAAHKKNIIHRDLKPANILVTKAGVKLLDFGLAKVGPAVQAGEGTMTMALTGKGEILGTFQYMSPEQVNGQEAGLQSDIFSLGLVLYELLTGKRAFDGLTPASVIAAILERPAPSVADVAPPALDRVLKCCLEKDPENRWRSAGDLKLTLELILLGDVRPVSTSSRRRWLWPAVAAALVLIAAASGWALWPRSVAPARPMRFQITTPEGVGDSAYIAVSPDGHKLVAGGSGAQTGLWIRDFDNLEWRKLPNTENARSPFWSPDSRFVAFADGNVLKKIDTAGGPPQTVCVTAGSPVGAGAWNREGIIIFGGFGSGSIRQVPAAGGSPTAITVEDANRGELSHTLPTFLPDGRHFLYFRGGPVEVSGIYSGSLDTKPSEQPLKRILATSYAAPYLDGNLFFIRDGVLMVQSFDASKLQLRGEPVPAAERVGTTDLEGTLSVSGTGVLAYLTSKPAEDEVQPTWFDRQGRVIGKAIGPGQDEYLRLSPDAARGVDWETNVGTSGGDLWLLDFARGIRTRLTFGQSRGSFPLWSPDGSRIAFVAGLGPSVDTIYEKAAGGAGNERELLKVPGEPKVPTSWSSDGHFLLYHTAILGRTGANLWVLPMEGPERTPRKPVLLLGTKFNEAYGSFSPDGRWAAYASDESGRYEVYVRPFIASGASGPSLGEAKWQVSKDGFGGAARAEQTVPKWRADGKEIIFRSPGGSPMAVDVSGSGATFQTGVPKQLFAAPANLGWDLTADGKRILMLVYTVQQNAQTPITVVLNWQGGLKK